MIELLWLLLPVAAASGWLAAKRSVQPSPPLSSFNISSDYFKGLNYLLNEEPDKAIDIFIKLIDVNSETVETHLALGGLFRRRGEVNRAIRIHQNLVARPLLSAQQRNLALLELAQDYRCAGLLDRAENLFLELNASKEHQTLALRQLLDIYQQEHDWDKAIHTAHKLAQVSSESMHIVIAHYYCEQAESLKHHGALEMAMSRVQQALKIDVRCVRASLLEGELALEKGETGLAIIAFKRVEQQDPTYLPEIIDPLQLCYQEQPQEFASYLYHVLEKYGGIVPMLALARLIKFQEGEQASADFIVKHLHKRPSVRGLDQLLDLALANVESITREHLLLLKDITTQLLKNKPLYKCHHCGFPGRSLHWQCPSCKQWSTFKPMKEIES